MTIYELLNDFAEAFKKKIHRNYEISIQLEIKDIPEEIFQIDVSNGDVFVYNEAKIIPEEIIMVLNKDILYKLYNNELSVLSAYLQTPSKNDGMMGALICEKKEPVGKEFINRLNYFKSFFSKDFPTKIILDNNYTVKHNGDIDTIGLKVFMNFGQIYISVKKGESVYYTRVDANLEINIYVIKGKGKIIVGKDEREIKEREYYYMSLLKPIEIKNLDDEPLEAIVVLQLSSI
jgi:hypothetical protein